MDRIVLLQGINGYPAGHVFPDADKAPTEIKAWADSEARSGGELIARREEVKRVEVESQEEEKADDAPKASKGRRSRSENKEG